MGKSYVKGSELIFISRIEKDGLSVELTKEKDMSFANNTIFKITPLSLSLETFIASEFATYVVKFKKK